ncbi:MAG: site-2 protease family protein [Clostridiales bacterium]|nr:site-2 protease family protein [Clostridiales bacterium]
MLYILIAILMFGILIALHEFGHFAAAKLCGVKVNEFSIGMGPQIVHKRGKETEYSFRLFPIGGFCAMEGEEEGESSDPRAFPNRPWWQRLIILLAGMGMNFLTGLLIILCLYSGVTAINVPVVAGFTAGEELEQFQGLEIGDRIVSVDGHAIYLTGDIALYLSRGNGSSADLVVERNGQKITIDNFQLTSQIGEDVDGANQVILGIRPAVERLSVIGRLKLAWFQSVDYVRMVWISLGDLVSGAVGLRDMSGPVGIIGMVGEVGREGAQAAASQGVSAFLGAMVNILQLTAFISINLSVMNLLPIPALDGGQIFFMAVNGVLLALRGRKMDPKYQNWVSMAGFACLMALMLAVTVSDILKKFGV